MSPAIYPYTVSNSFKGGLFMRTYSRNVRRAWDGDEYRQPKRQRIGEYPSLSTLNTDENIPQEIDLEDNLERAIRETSVAALSSSSSRKNSTIFSLNESNDGVNDISNTLTPPSSPPHALQITPPNIRARKPLFKSLQKKKTDKQSEHETVSKSRPNADATSDSTRQETSDPLMEILNSSKRLTANNSALREPTSPDLHMESHTETALDSVVQSAPKPAPSKQNLVQTVLDLGQSLTPTTCAKCQMSYTPSVAEDVQLHNMWHHRNSSGIELGKPFLKSAMKWCYEVPQIPGSVVVVDRKISVPARRAVQRALEVINKELGSVEIKEEELWSQRTLEGDEDDAGRKCDRYKAFLHIIDGKCVGVCLAERIAKAHHVLPNQDNSTPIPSHQMRLAHDQQHVQQPPSPPMTEELSGSTNMANSDIEKKSEGESTTKGKEASDMSLITPHYSYHLENGLDRHQSSSITISDETYPAIVGVSRIWTSKSFRRKGIANNLLECVMNQFIYGMEIERSQIAFSQPTESGCQLAKQWFGVDHGWAVYCEE